MCKTYIYVDKVIHVTGGNKTHMLMAILTLHDIEATCNAAKCHLLLKCIQIVFRFLNYTKLLIAIWQKAQPYEKQKWHYLGAYFSHNVTCMETSQVRNMCLCHMDQSRSTTADKTTWGELN